MNLQATLLKYVGRNVKVGAKDGTSFIYCDIIESKKDIIKIFDRLNTMYNRRLKETQRADIAKLKNLEATIGARKKFEAKQIYKNLVNNALSDVPDIDKVDINQLMAEIDEKYTEVRQHDANRMMHKIRKQKHMIDGWTPLLQREVKVIRESIKDDDTITDKADPNIRAIIIEYAGEEKGLYWDRNEYLNGVQIEDEEEDADDTE